MSQAPDFWEGEHLSSPTLLRFRRGELDANDLLTADDHLAGCAACRARLQMALSGSGPADASLLSLVQSFSRGEVASSDIPPPIGRLTVPRFDFPDFEQIADYVDGLLSPSERASFETVMRARPDLAREVEELRVLKRELNAEVPLVVPATSSLLAPEVVPLKADSDHPPPTQAETRTVQVPPMKVQSAPSRETPKKSWWERFVLPMQSFGAAAMAALLVIIIGVSPLRQELLTQRTLQSQREHDLQTQIADAQNRSQQLRDQAAQLKAQLNRQKQGLESRNTNLQKNLGDLQSRINDLNARIESQNSEIARLNASPDRPQPAQPEPTRASAPSPTPGTAPTSPPAPASTIIPDGDGLIINQGNRLVRVSGAQVLSPSAVAALRQGTLPESPSVAALRSPAQGAKGAEKRFRVISPVATRVRETRPELIWEAVPGAISYSVSLRDDTTGTRVLSQSQLTGTHWQIPRDLQPGHRYLWQVKAFQGTRLIGLAPQKPDVAARFEVLSTEESNALRAKLSQVGNSLLQRSLILAEAGLKTEAQRTLDQLRK